MKKKPIILALKIIGIGFIPFLGLIIYSSIYGGVYWFPFYEKFLLLLAGPLTLLIMEPDLLFIRFGTEAVNYQTLGLLFLATVALSTGITGFKRAILFKIIFTIGVLLWFWFGITTIALFYVTV